MEGIEEADPYGNYEWLASKRRKMEDVETIEATKSPYLCPKSVYKFKQVVKSSSDKRNYRVFTLANKIKIVLISDPDSVKSAAAVSIQAGSMSEPKEFPGMAHLCERMLFAGNSSVANSDETCFETFLQKYDGEYSSYTQRDLAVHVFDVNPAAFLAALDRFARYFICPTFPRDSLEEEVDGIQAECDSRAASDDERRSLVAALLTKSDHPFSRFDCGNKDTLWNKPLKEGSVDTLRSELVKFYKEHYSSNLMCLAVLGVESCDELQKMVENIFQYVDNTNKVVPRWAESPYGPLQFMTKIEIVPLQNLRKLFLIFPIPDFTKQYKTGAILYLRYVLGYEGPGSLVTTLKRENFIKKLDVDYEQPGTGFAFITLDFQLTKSGQDELDRVITHLFQYVKMIRKEGPQRRLWEEMKVVNETKFRFLPHESAMNYVENLVTLMPVVPQEEILSCRYLLSESKLELIRDLFNFISPNRMRMITSWPENIHVADEVDEWFGCKYKYSTIDDKLIQRWNHCYLYPEFKSPPPNPFIATVFDLKARDTKAENNLPRLLDENELTRIWFLQDSVFREPKATIIMHVISPLPQRGPSEFNLTRLLAKIVEDALLEFSSAATVAGLMYNVEASIAGLTTTVHGYDHKIHILFNYVLNRLFHFVSFGNVGYRFEAIKNTYLEELEQWSYQEPYLHASEYVEQLLSHNFWSVEELLLSMKDDNIPPARLVTFAQKFFAQVKLEWFFHGNFTEKESLRICQSALEYFRCVNSRPIPPSKLKEPQEVILESGSAIYQAEHKGGGTSKNQVSCAALVLQTDLSCMKDKVVIELIESILYDPAYNIVPGKDKLIWTDMRRSRESLALIIVVQATKEVAVLEESMESFLDYMHTELKNMSREEFLEHRVDLALKKANKNKSLWDRGVEMFQEIFKQQYDFDSYNVELRELQKVTLSDLAKFYEEWILPSSNKRKKLCVHVVPAATEQNTIAPANPLLVIGIPKDEQKFPRENLYTATNNATVPPNNSIIQKWTPTVKNSIRDDICTRGSTALNAFARASTINTATKENNSNVSCSSENAAKTRNQEDAEQKTAPTKEGSDEDESEDAEGNPDDDSSSDSNESTMIKEYYFKIEEEIRALSNLKRHLLSGLKKTHPENQNKSEETVAASAMIAEGGEAQQEEKEKGTEKDIEANIEFERLLPSHLHPDQLHLPSEFNVYTLTSIESTRQKSNSSNHSNPKINNKNNKGKTKYKDSSEDENCLARSSSRRQSPRPNPPKMTSRARLSRDSNLKKESGERSNSRSRPSSSTYKTKSVNKEPRPVDSRFLKSESKVPEKKSETKASSKKQISTSDSEPERPKSRKVKPHVKPSQDTLTETLKKTISEMDDVEEIEELDFDIQKEIIRLQKLRTLLDAKAKRILNKESVPKSESEARTDKRQKNPRKKPKESNPSLENNPADSPENVPSIRSIKSKTKFPRPNNKKKQRTTTLYKCLQELRTNLTEEEYQHIIEASEDKLKATIKQYQQGSSLPNYDANENLFVSGDKDCKENRDPELINWLRETVVEEEKLNIQKSMLKTRKEIDCLNNTYLLSATLDSYSNTNSQAGKMFPDESTVPSFLTSTGNFSDLPNNLINNDPSLQPKVTLNKSEINKDSKNLVRKQSVPRRISNLKALKALSKTSKNGSSKFAPKEALRPFRFGLGRLARKASKESNKVGAKISKNPYPLKPVRKPSQNSNGCKRENKNNEDFQYIKSISTDESGDEFQGIAKGKSSGEDSDGDSSSGADQMTRKCSLKDFQFNVGVGQLKSKKPKKADQVKKEEKEKDQIKSVNKFKEDLKTSQRKGNTNKKGRSDAKHPKIKLDDMSPKEFGVKHRRELAAEKKKNLNNDMAEFKNSNVPTKGRLVKSISLNSDDSDPDLGFSVKDENTEKSDKVGDSGSAEIIAVVKARDDRSSTESVAEDVSKTNANPARVKIINDIRKWRKTMQLYAQQKSLQD